MKLDVHKKHILAIYNLSSIFIMDVDLYFVFRLGSLDSHMHRNMQLITVFVT